MTGQAAFVDAGWFEVTLFGGQGDELGPLDRRSVGASQGKAFADRRHQLFLDGRHFRQQLAQGWCNVAEIGARCIVQQGGKTLWQRHQAGNQQGALGERIEMAGLAVVAGLVGQATGNVVNLDLFGHRRQQVDMAATAGRDLAFKSDRGVQYKHAYLLK